MIRYSVILPWHQDDALLQRAIRSVPERPDVELLSFRDQDFRGAGFARNKCLEQASGEWLLFLDSDDYFMPEAFSLLDAHASDPAEVVYFNIVARMSRSGLPSLRQQEKQRCLEAFSQDPGRLEFFCRYCYPEPWGKMVRRSLVEREGIRFDETSCANDYMFSMLCGIKARSVAYDPGELYCVTEREGSVSSSYFDKPGKILDRLDVYWRVQQLFDGAGVPLYPFAGLWMMCRKAGPEARSIAGDFRKSRAISRWRIWRDCAVRVVRKRLRLVVPNCP